MAGVGGVGAGGGHGATLRTVFPLASIANDGHNADEPATTGAGCGAVGTGTLTASAEPAPTGFVTRGWLIVAEAEL